MIFLKHRIFIFFSGIFLFLITGPYIHAQPLGKPAYGPGENLYYRISYSFVTAGKAVISVQKDTLHKRPVYHLKVEARTSGLADVVYRIRDVYESYMNTETERPIKAIRNISEGRYRKYNEVVFDYNTRNDSTIVFSRNRGKVVVPKNIYDILTGFFYFRNHYVHYPFKKGELFVFHTYFTDELWDLKIRYKRKETIKTHLGKIKCLRFAPVTEVGRAFKSEEDMAVWFSDDDNFVPVKIWFNLRVGSFKAELEECEGLLYPWKVK